MINKKKYTFWKKNREKSEETNEEKFLDLSEFEVSTLWRIYEKTSSNKTLAIISDLKIPALILFYELVNCNEMKSLTHRSITKTATSPNDNKDNNNKPSKIGSNERNVYILTKLCELIDDADSAKNDKDSSSCKQESSIDFVLKTITKQIVKNGISVFFPSSDECRDYFFAIVDENTTTTKVTDENPSPPIEQATSPIKLETSLSKPSGKLLFEALCNLFSSNRSNMVQYLIGGRTGASSKRQSSFIFDTTDLQKPLIELVEKMLRLSASLDDSGSSSINRELENRLIASLIDLLDSIQSNLFYKVRQTLVKTTTAHVHHTSTRFVHDYARLLIDKSEQFLTRFSNSSRTEMSFFLQHFFTKLVHNFVLWLNEILPLFKLATSTTFTSILISFYELTDKFNSLMTLATVSWNLMWESKKDGFCKRNTLKSEVTLFFFI